MNDNKLQSELIQWLDQQIITSENIGNIRRRVLLPWDCEWNGFVRDETAKRETLGGNEEHQPIKSEAGYLLDYLLAVPAINLLGFNSREDVSDASEAGPAALYDYHAGETATGAEPKPYQDLPGEEQNLSGGVEVTDTQTAVTLLAGPERAHAAADLSRQGSGSSAPPAQTQDLPGKGNLSGGGRDTRDETYKAQDSAATELDEGESRMSAMPAAHAPSQAEPMEWTVVDYGESIGRILERDGKELVVIDTNFNYAKATKVKLAHNQDLATLRRERDGLKQQYDNVHAIAVEKDRLWSEACNERNKLRRELAEAKEQHAQLQAKCYEGFPSSTDGIFDALANQSLELAQLSRANKFQVKELADLRARLAQAEADTARQWISLADRSPTREDGDNTACVMYRNKDSGPVIRSWADAPLLATHWMPIPTFDNKARGRPPLPETPKEHHVGCQCAGCRAWADFAKHGGISPPASK